MSFVKTTSHPIRSDRAEIVDLHTDPLAAKARRRRTLLRIGLPLCAVGLIVGFLFGIGLYTYRANRDGVLGLSDNLLQGLRERVSLQVSAYLEPAAHAALLGHSMLGRGGAAAQASGAETFAASILKQTPQVTNVLFADPAGNFLLVTRTAPAADSTKSKHISVSPVGRSVVWTTHDAAGAVIGRREDPADTYDARTRSWFTGARGIDDVFWSTPYIFFTERAPGITVAVHGPGPDPDVIAVDIKLDALSGFLRGLAIGRTGRAYIVAPTGEMIAGPDPSLLLKTVDGQLKPARVDGVGDPDLVASWDHFRVDGVGSRIIDADGRRMISIVTKLDSHRETDASGAGKTQDWLLAIIVPEADFSGFVKLNTQRAASLFLVVVGLAAGLGLLLVRQGLRTDRSERIMAERSEAARMQGEAFARLARELSESDASAGAGPGFTETLASASGARRVTLWQWGAGGQSMFCRDSFEPASGGHVAGLELSRQEVPALMEAASRGEVLDVADARQDRRTVGLHALFMRPLGSKALFAVPVSGAGGVRGLLMLEDAGRSEAIHTLVRTGAALLSLRMQGAGDARQAAAALAPPPAAAPLDGRQIDAGFVEHAGGVAQADQAVVLVLRLPPAALARAAVDAEGGLLGHRIACAAQAIASHHGIPYLKMLGTTIVAAAGPAFGSDAAGDAAARIAQATVDLREHCQSLFGEEDDTEEFAFGLDAGRVLGGLVGPPPGLYNIWGEALEGARTLADSARDGSVQTSEAAYGLLRTRFLFRPRGLFHRPGLGDTRCYVLGGAA